MLHAKSELDFTSLSSPYSNDSPKYPAYYVQSPSRYSHDDVSRMASVQASPAYNTSPMDSPLYSSTFGRSSNPRSSSASRISGNWRYSRGNRKRVDKAWPEFECRVIEEDGVYDDRYADQRDGTLSPYLMAIVGSAAVLAAFCFILWGVSRSYKPHISMQRLKVNNFYVGEGSDQTGVPTKFLTINSTAIMSIHNPATFFGIHVTSKPVDLTFWEITVATGELKEHYQPRKSFCNVTLDLDGSKVPLYGAGATLEDGRGVPLKLDMKIQTCGYLLGGLVKTRQHRHITCSLVFNPKGTKDIKFQKHSCTYD